jgi:hypothetical protein
MKLLSLAAVAIFSLATGSVAAQTAIQAGEWESTEKSSMEGMQPMPATSKKVCLKGADAQLERLLFPTPEEMKQHGCRYEEGPKKAGVLAATLTCPPTETVPGVTAKAEISYSATSYQGTGQLEAHDAKGHRIKGSSELSGKRLGDCP